MGSALSKGAGWECGGGPLRRSAGHCRAQLPPIRSSLITGSPKEDMWVQSRLAGRQTLPHRHLLYFVEEKSKWV